MNFGQKYICLSFLIPHRLWFWARMNFCIVQGSVTAGKRLRSLKLFFSEKVHPCRYRNGTAGFSRIDVVAETVDRIGVGVVNPVAGGIVENNIIGLTNIRKY